VLFFHFGFLVFVVCKGSLSEFFFQVGFFFFCSAFVQFGFVIVKV